MKEYRDEAMKRLEKAEREDIPSDPAELARANFEVNAAIANSLVDIAESLQRDPGKPRPRRDPPLVVR